MPHGIKERRKTRIQNLRMGEKDEEVVSWLLSGGKASSSKLQENSLEKQATFPHFAFYIFHFALQMTDDSSTNTKLTLQNEKGAASQSNAALITTFLIFHFALLPSIICQLTVISTLANS